MFNYNLKLKERVKESPFNIIKLRYMKLLKFSIIVALGFSSIIAAAQPGNNKIIIQGKFTPSIDDASKINTSPVLEDTVYSTPEFSYKIEERKLETPFKVAPIRPAKLVGEPLNKLYSNYVALGMGNYLTPYFEFYHSKLRSRDTKYGVHLKHFSSAGKINDYAFPAWSQNIAEVYGSKFWKKSVLSVNVGYKRDVNHFYGFKPELYPDSVLPEDVDIAQRYNLVNADLHWYRYRVRRSEMKYDIKTSYYFLNDFYHNSEHNIAANSYFDWGTSFYNGFKKERLGFQLNEKFYSNIWDTVSTQITNLLDVKPYYKFEFGQLSAFFGVNMQVKTDTISSLNFYPDIRLNLAAIPNVLYFNFNLTGGQRRNSLKSFSDENPFIISQIPLGFTNQKYQINFGLGSSISKSVNFDVQLYYSKYEHAPLFVTDTNSLYNNQFTVVYDDYDELKLQADITYRLHEKLQFLLRGNYYVYNMNTELFPWHKPSYDISLTGNYNIQNKVIIKAALISYGSSYAPVWENGVQSTSTIKAWVDLNFGIEYRYRKKLGIFLNFNNVTATRYYRWYDYPSYKFNILGGFSYVF
jgi:hypothetical protein